MIKLVLDTNILVSAIISPNGAPANVLRLVSDEAATLYFNDTIMSEYTDVLHRKKLKLEQSRVEKTIKLVKENTYISVTKSTIPLPDETDRIFYDTATAAGAYLVTGNMKHYPAEPHILTPAAFLDLLASEI